MTETTPIVWEAELYRFEIVRAQDPNPNPKIRTLGLRVSGLTIGTTRLRTILPTSASVIKVDLHFGKRVRLPRCLSVLIYGPNPNPNPNLNPTLTLRCLLVSIMASVVPLWMRISSLPSGHLHQV